MALWDVHPKGKFCVLWLYLNIVQRQKDKTATNSADPPASYKSCFSNLDGLGKSVVKNSFMNLIESGFGLSSLSPSFMHTFGRIKSNSPII